MKGNTNYDLLDKINNGPEQNVRDTAAKNFTPIQLENGTWINSYEEFQALYKSTNDIERYLRS